MTARSGRPDRMMTVKEYALATPSTLGGAAGYERFCGAATVRARSDGWGLLLCENDDGSRATLGVDDVGWVELLLLAQDHGGLEGLELPPAKVVWRREGWPDAWGTVTSPTSPGRP